MLIILMVSYHIIKYLSLLLINDSRRGLNIAYLEKYCYFLTPLLERESCHDKFRY